MTLGKEVFAVLHPTRGCPEKHHADGCGEQDEQCKRRPERGLEAKLTRASLGVVDPLVEPPGGHAPADRGEDDRGDFQQTRGAGRWHVIP